MRLCPRQARPRPRGAGLVAARLSKKLLQYAGLEDAYTSTEGNTKTGGNFIMATFDAVRKSYHFLTPNLWKETPLIRTPYDEHSDFLLATQKGTLAKIN